MQKLIITIGNKLGRIPKNQSSYFQYLSGKV
jgi:hypothetical protein